jgi:glycosyltransferase involved in cell wall biosynthesis
MIEGMVSTIIPVHNRAAMLREAVASVISQSWRPIEIVIVDDGSTDDTGAVIAELAATHPQEIRGLHQANAGPGAARQAGLEAARGEFIQFLDSDDLLLEDKFALQVAALRADPSAAICYGKSYSSAGGVRDPSAAQKTGEVHRKLFPAMLDEPLWPTLVPLYRRSVLAQVGPWPRAMQLEDWRYDAQAASLDVELAYVDRFVAETRNHDDERLCHRWLSDSAAMRDRLQAFLEVSRLAGAAGVDRSSPEVRRFVRTLFWMARQAGARGFPAEARQLLREARAHADSPAWDLRLYGIAMRLLGPRLAASLAGVRAGEQR